MVSPIDALESPVKLVESTNISIGEKLARFLLKNVKKGGLFCMYEIFAVLNLLKGGDDVETCSSRYTNEL